MLENFIKMHFVISSLATLKSSVQYDDIWCGKKNDDKSERQNAERHISGQQKYMFKEKNV